jgi:L-ribulose-5-phosphate 4-epimerase
VRTQVLQANRKIVNDGLVELTWGNVSFFDRPSGLVFIKPSGVDLSIATRQEISVLNMQGELLSGQKPSVDLPTHLEIYKGFEEINCVIHTHSKYATIFAQACQPVPCLGTTHADYFNGDIPCVPHATEDQVNEAYEKFTGLAITEFYKGNSISCMDSPACLVSGHGVFAWSDSIEKALEIAKVTEIVSEMAHKTLLMNNSASIKQFILSKHFLRKNGVNKTYGQ